MSISSVIARVIYGKSDSPNAPDNVNDQDFQAGYKVGLGEEYEGGDPFALIREEWNRRGKPCPHTSGFTNCKRGLWAARLQKVCL